MIRWATAADIGRLRRLMSDCFGDTAEQTAAFMDRLFDEKTALCYEAEGEIVSALYLLPAEAYVEGRSYCALYIYAAATDPRFRGRGYMAALLGFAADNCACDYLTLTAADEGLCGYYAKFGFERSLGLARQRFVFGEGSAVDIVRADVDYVFNCRRAAVAHLGGVNWSCTLFDYAYNLYESEGMQWLRFDGGYALVDAGAKAVVELCAEQATDALEAICQRYGWDGCDYYSLNSPAPQFGMYKPLRDGLPPLGGIMGLSMQ